MSRRSLRYYEKHGLLHAGRAVNGWRLYGDALRPSPEQASGARA